MLEVVGVLKVAKDELRANYKSGTFPKCNYKFPVKCQKKKADFYTLTYCWFTNGRVLSLQYPLPTNQPTNTTFILMRYAKFPYIKSLLLMYGFIRE